MRWGVPVAAVAVVGAAVGAGPVVAAVQGEPSLPERTAQQLLAEVAKTAQRHSPPAMSGTVVETASLGLPALPIPSGASSSPLSLLSGSHTVKVWYGGDDRLRIALPGQMSETDLISDGEGQAWLWDSEKNTATRIKLPAKPEAGTPGTARSALPSALTPDAAAAELLKAAGEDTAVTVENGQTVAGRAAYQLVLAPKDAKSLVERVKVALDGENYMPLRVQVYAKGTAEPAFEVGFTQVSFSTPAPENFAFTPPAGAKVETQELGSAASEAGATPWGEGAGDHAAKHAGAPRTFGSGWTTVAELPFSLAELTASPAGGGRHGEAADPGRLVNSVLKSAKQISGPWGSGKVLRTKLVSALFTDDGRLLVGAVTPEALAEAAGRG
ncbi:DUF2092 domain-containing protein [Sphaerisporangium sp. TRM90804]|uniref:LolA family protein n=1 Tax=Sphaerisporangium sp. TRM90804 TaxID=3031113 RepID=UPI00244A4EDD|nr:DUF2092 domain-containing protein [Sphaerisporangium sp. TRM90804]MDH2429506.1 DUF2092 domain-containing protein [Sphaerisporangium sp. TRM90804]